MNVLNVKEQVLKLGKKKIKLTYVRTIILSRLANNIPNTCEDLWYANISVKKSIRYFRSLGLNIQTKVNIGYILEDKIYIE